MATQPTPEDKRVSLQVFRWFVLTVALAPMLICGGCLGLAVFSSIFSGPPGPAADPSAPAARGTASVPPSRPPGQTRK
jgi:hypothetical protein